MPATVVVVADDPWVALVAEAALAEGRFHVVHAGPAPGPSAAGRWSAACVLVDVGSNGDGAASVAAAAAVAGDAPLIALVDPGADVAALDRRVADHVVKGPATGELLRRSVTYAIETRQAEEMLRRREAQLAETQALARLGTWEWDVGADTVECSAELYRLFGLEPSGLEPTLDGFLAAVHPDDRAEVDRVVRSALATRRAYVVEHRVSLPDGEVRWVHGRGHVEESPDGAPLRMFGTVQDVTDRHLAQEGLEEQAALARFTADVAVAAGAGESLATMLRRCCDAVVRNLDAPMATVWRSVADGFSLEARAGEAAADYDDLVPLTSQECADVLAGGRPHVSPAEGPHGERYLLAFPLVADERAVGILTVRSRRLPSQELLAALSAVSRQIALGMDQNRAVEELAHQALHDPLTGVPNRILFVDRLDQALRRSLRHDTRVAVLFVDLDRFKLINDSFGHAAGDRVLAAVAARLSQSLRPGDTVARFGGDEFTVLCEDLADDEAVLPIAERALAALEDPIALEGGREAFVTASIGVAVVAPGDATSADTVLGDADSAMYQAKERGRNRVEVFDHDMRARVVARIEQAAELRRALEIGELRVHYQPEIRLSDESMSGVEALVRWQHPAFGLLGPDDFIGVAEETGLVVALGAEVLRTACSEMAGWDGLPGHRGLTMAVNLSARQLAEPGVIDAVWNALNDTGIAPERLCLEITESVLMEDVVSSVEALLGLKALGVRLAVDDFGTGYSSLSYLRRFPVDVVKVDRSFVAGLGVDPAADAIVAAVVNLAHALGLTVVGEGVETEEQLVALRALGCDRAQGHLWSGALPPEELRAWRMSRTAPVASTAVDLRAIVIERTDAQRAATGRPFVLELPAGLPPAQADWGAVKNVVDHLLSNAVTYSGPERPVVVSASADRRWVRLSVADFGIGMTGEEMARCFEQFWQSSAGARYRRGGTGMGLSSVRSLVEAMGGRVAVKSAVGKGSTFTVVLPRAGRVTQRPRQPVVTPGLGDPSIVREFMRQIGVPTRRDP